MVIGVRLLFSEGTGNLWGSRFGCPLKEKAIDEDAIPRDEDTLSLGGANFFDLRSCVFLGGVLLLVRDDTIKFPLDTR